MELGFEVIKSIHKIEESHKKMSSLGKRLRILFLVFFAAICAGAIAVLGLSLYALFVDESATITLYDAFSIVSAMLNFVIYGAVLLILAGLSKDIAQGLSPFTNTHARQIRNMGWLFVANFILSIIISPGFTYITSVGGLDFGFSSSQVGEYPSLPLDVGSLIGAVVCFSLSVIWKYGELLQSETDDLC